VRRRRSGIILCIVDSRIDDAQRRAWQIVLVTKELLVEHSEARGVGKELDRGELNKEDSPVGDHWLASHEHLE
jgi:hypothetical protein